MSREIKFRAWVKKTVDHRWEWAYAEAERRIERQPHLEQMESDIREEYLEQWDKEHSPDERYTITELYNYGELVKIECMVLLLRDTVMTL
jgi:hypothetical protein